MLAWVSARKHARTRALTNRTSPRRYAPACARILTQACAAPTSTSTSFADAHTRALFSSFAPVRARARARPKSLARATPCVPIRIQLDSKTHHAV
eukprot:3377073-Pleurochrysis_carterae.AAC.3